MKIIRVDNFNREGSGHNDEVIAENVSVQFGKSIVKYLNDAFCSHPYSPDFFKLVMDDYKLYKFEP